MTTYAVKREIHAEPQTIWDLLTDASTYPSWNPAVLGIEGSIAAGEQIKLTSVVNPNRSFKLTVTEFSPPHTMVWADGMPLGLFKGERTFQITPKRDGVVGFAMEEVYSGVLAPMITKSIPDMTDSFEMFADGLKQAAESR
jgi:hypothetical protein